MAGEIDRKVLERLDEWEKDSPPEPIELYARLMRLQIEAKANIAINKTQPPQEVISERLSLALPALTFDDLAIDWEKVEGLFRQALSMMSEYSVPIDHEGEFDVKKLAKTWYEGKSLARKVVDAEALAVAMHTAVKPFLAAYAEALLPQVDQKLWRKGYCPICGGGPNLAYLSSEEEGARYLVCARCDTQWLFQRLECPFCGIREQKSLAYFTDDSGMYRVYVCEECKRYLKALDLRQAKADVLMPLEWVATLDLDRQACEMGYKAGDLVPTKSSKGKKKKTNK